MRKPGQPKGQAPADAAAYGPQGRVAPLNFTTHLFCPRQKTSLSRAFFAGELVWLHRQFVVHCVYMVLRSSQSLVLCEVQTIEILRCCWRMFRFDWGGDMGYGKYDSR